MPGPTPEATFLEARAALARRDWAAFFACCDTRTLHAIAGNSLRAFVHHPDGLPADLLDQCRRYEVPVPAIERLREIGTEMTASARQVDTEAYDTQRHRALVADYDRTLQEALMAAVDLPGFTAELEKRMRASRGGGSVAADLFEDETLHDVEITGRRAWAVRRSRWAEEDLGFERRGGVWLIRLLAQRRR